MSPPGRKEGRRRHNRNDGRRRQKSCEESDGADGWPLTDHLDSAVKKSVTEVAAELTEPLHWMMTYWESKKQTQRLGEEAGE